MPRPLNQTDTDLNADNLLRLPAEFGCPVWVYDAQIVREKIAALHQFDVVRFAQKACSNIHILRLMREQGVKVDSVSLGEIERALVAGYDPKADSDAIVFTADVIDDATLARVHELQIPVMIGVGGTFDVMAGKAKRAPVWMQRAGLEWSYRLLRQPSRFVRMLALPRFVARVLLSAWTSR